MSKKKKRPAPLTPQQRYAKKRFPRQRSVAHQLYSAVPGPVADTSSTGADYGQALRDMERQRDAALARLTRRANVRLLQQQFDEQLEKTEQAIHRLQRVERLAVRILEAVRSFEDGE